MLGNQVPSPGRSRHDARLPPAPRPAPAPADAARCSGPCRYRRGSRSKPASASLPLAHGIGRAGSGPQVALSARSKRSTAARASSCGTRPSTRADQRARCASSAAKLSKHRPARALRLTYFTPDSTLPLVRARYGRHARGVTSQSRQNARSAGLKRTWPVSRSRSSTSARALSPRMVWVHPAEMAKRHRRFPPANHPDARSGRPSRRFDANSQAPRRADAPWCARPAISTHFSPKSTCIWCPGSVSNRTVATCAAMSS